MAEELIADAIEQQNWLEPVETGLHDAVTKTYVAAGPAGQKVKNFLHGTWLGHPLHPVLTDIPLGAWTATLVLDICEAAGDKRYAPAADLTLKVGLAGAVGAALAGLTDWQATDGGARRVGAVHGILNVTAAACYTASLIARNGRNRQTGRTLACIGYAIGAASAWLGGNLVYAKKIGVNHTTAEGAPQDWTAVLDEAALPEDLPQRVQVNGLNILLVRRGGTVYAISETCSHLGGPLSEGKLDGDSIECPWHASRFCIKDGSVIDGPATHPQPRFDARVANGKIEIRALQNRQA
ncbi:MAG TPA: Rieske (2Fe-2S) protein [Candidatus Limnocylindrales bacterium]|nr:Rieske (2Fe-2S) protein [Candidatus Limnocylindrales bacterium]